MQKKKKKKKKNTKNGEIIKISYYNDFGNNKYYTLVLDGEKKVDHNFIGSVLATTLSASH